VQAKSRFHFRARRWNEAHIDPFARDLAASNRLHDAGGLSTFHASGNIYMRPFFRSCIAHLREGTNWVETATHD
jgi:hypothetical protein